MLARLFNNLTVQSLASALLMSFMVVGVASFLHLYTPAELFIGGWSVTISPFVFRLSVTLLIPLYSTWFNGLLIRQGFLKGHHYMIPILSIVLWLFGCYENYPSVLLILPLLILLIGQVLSLITAGSGVLQIIFNIGFLTGIGSVFFPPILVFLVVCWVSVILFGHFNLRSVIIPVVGLAAFYFLMYTGYFFFTDQSFKEVLWEMLIQYRLSTLDLDIMAIWPYFFLTIAVLMSLLEYIKALNHAKIQKRQFLNFNAALLVLGLALFIPIQSPWAGEIIMAFPVAVFLSNLVQYVNKWWMKDLVYLSLIVTLVFVVL
ncbi:MAG TPA: hypothetical protein DCG19_09930 [Cryomorphaceae bacterium]|nr:hypothetical protein [Owenweeksia sp.]HAD97713.1 hypothetical protein [Cryomorphaceae bacterium]HBF20198.1 hypothetical protein [Cryomorphaceae bacterium]